MKKTDEPRNPLLESLLRFLSQEKGEEKANKIGGQPPAVTTYLPPKPEESSSPLGSALGIKPQPPTPKK